MEPEPSEEAITSFVSFTSTTRGQAISFLKANNLDSQRAINAYFEDPTGPKPSASDWENERNLAPLGYTTPDDGSRLTATAPPSRPPSRVNTYDPPQRVGNDSSTTAITSKDSDQNLSLAEREEKELQRAVALSLDQDFASQETGVTLAAPESQAQFSKATREHYDRDDWAMTIFKETAEEVVTSPDPEDRRKIEGEPAFIRPSPESLYLGGLITILHAIPLAREALLSRNKHAPNYGKEPQWWNGKPIRMPMIVTQGKEDDADWEEPIFETQRLMAFLDLTERAFGSIDALANTKAMLTNSSDSDEAVIRFLETWYSSSIRADPDNPMSLLFMTQAYKKSPFEMEDDDGPVSKELFVFEPGVERGDGQTLYDVLDNAIWGDQPGEDLDEVWLENVGEVLVMRLDSPDKLNSVDIAIPATFYPDRYMSACQDQSRELRGKKLEAQVYLKNIQEQIFHWETSEHEGMTKADVLEKSADQIPIALEHAVQGQSTTMTPDMAREKIERIPRQLREVASKIKKKLEDLAVEKGQAEKALRACSNILTEPSNTPHEPPTRKYTLRGVCTEPHITYVLRYRPWEDESEIVRDEDQPSDAQWWRISFSAEDGKIVQAEKKAARGDNSPTQDGDIVGYTARRVRQSEVLQAASKEWNKVLLVYASEAATQTSTWSQGPSPLLSKFVHQDNRAFAEELNENREDPPAYTPPKEQEPEQKGKQTADEMDISDNETSSSTLGQFNSLIEGYSSDYKPGKSRDNGSDSEQSSGREMQEKRGSRFLTP